jgi:NAD-dependent DNA ligase
LYYNTDQTRIKDEIYDVLKDWLIKKDPEWIPPVGSKIRNNDNRSLLPFWMGSANKITPDESKELNRWFDNNSSKKIFITDKLDGVSGMFVYKDGKKKLYTRGDGTEGGDISYLIQYIDNFPTEEFKDNIVVRGELIIKKKVFNNKYYDGKIDTETKKSKERTYKNARNMVSGLVGAKTVRSGLFDVNFVAYEIVGDETMEKPSVQFSKLQNMGFTVAKNKKVNSNRNVDFFVDLHNNFKKESEYEIDGIIVQSDVSYDRNSTGNPSYMFAFKVNSDDNIHETTVLDIDWSITSWGQIIPVAVIDPIELPGNTIERVTVSNAGLMVEKGIGPGAIINVTRSKEVIPYIVNVVEECEDIKWPEVKYEWDENKVHIIVAEESPEIIAVMRVKFFAKFFDKMGIKHVSEATVKKLYNNGFDTLLKILAVDKNRLLDIDGIKEKSAERIVNNIKNGLKGVKVPELLGASSVFGFGVGRKRVIALMTDIPDLLTAKKKGLKKRILEVEGFSEIMAQKVYENIDSAVEFVDEISKFVSFTEDTRVSDVLVGQKFVFSGFRSKELEQDIIDRGGKIVSSVSKKTNGIVVNNKDGKQSTKVVKAESLGIKIYTKEEFIKKYIYK